MKKPWWSGIGLAIFIVLVLGLAPVLPPLVASAAEGYPCRYTGPAAIDGEPVPPDTEITAWVGGAMVAGPALTGADDLEDNYYAIKVELETTPNPNEVLFKIGDLWANEIYTWDMYGGVVAPLTATEGALVAQITSPQEGATFSAGQEYAVTAIITNARQQTVDDVTATVGPGATASVVGDATQDLGDIPAGESRMAEWTLRCEGPGDSAITVTPGNAGGAFSMTSDSVTVHQEAAAALEVQIIEPLDGSVFSSGQEFIVTATITNTGEATATGATATVDAGATASLVAGDSPQMLGAILGGESCSAVWTLRCDGSGDSTIAVDALGTDANAGATVSGSDSIVVYQQAAAELVVEIAQPADGQTFYPGQTYTVSAAVTNIGEATAEGVIAEIDPGATASLIAGLSPQTLGDIPGGESRTATWTLECVVQGDSTITVSASGIDVNRGQVVFSDDIVTVHQVVTMGLVAGVNMIAYNGATCDLPDALTNISDVTEIVWARGAWTGGEWLCYDNVYPAGSDLSELVNGYGYVIVVTQDCVWELPS